MFPFAIESRDVSRFLFLPKVRKARKDMATSTAVCDSLTQVGNTRVEGVQWCPGCNHTRTLDHFTPLRLGVPYYRPYCNECAPPLPHRRFGWFHPLIKSIWASFRNLAERLQTGSDPKKAPYDAESAQSRAAWSVNPAPGATTFVRLADGLLIDMSSPDALQLLACLQSCEAVLKQHNERTPDQQHEIRHSRSGHTSSGILEPDASVLRILEPIKQGEQRNTDRLQYVRE